MGLSSSRRYLWIHNRIALDFSYCQTNLSLYFKSISKIRFLIFLMADRNSLLNYLMVKILCYNTSIKGGTEMTKRLTRDVRNKKIAGVCAGVANYFEIDPTIVRLIWGIAFLVYGIGFIPYLILWFVLPKNDVDDDVIWK